jgi:hypothetical protein
VEDKSDPEKSKIFFLRRVQSSATDVRKTFARVRLEQQTQILVKEQAEIPQNQQAGAGSSGGTSEASLHPARVHTARNWPHADI